MPSVPGLIVVAGGAAFAYSAIKGKNFSSVVRTLINGGDPASATATPAISTGSAVTAMPGIGALQANPGGTTYQAFFTAVLQGLGRPVTQGNLLAFADIVVTEGQNNYWNPMNFTYHDGQSAAMKGVGNWNAQGVQEYASESAGIAATIAGLQQPAWAAVNTALISGNQQLVHAALNAEYASWGSHVGNAGTDGPTILAAAMGAGT